MTEWVDDHSQDHEQQVLKMRQSLSLPFSRNKTGLREVVLWRLTVFGFEMRRNTAYLTWSFSRCEDRFDNRFPKQEDTTEAEWPHVRQDHFLPSKLTPIMIQELRNSLTANLMNSYNNSECGTSLEG